jgi:hypothetical protein
MHAVTRCTFGISLPQNLNASCSQAHLCSAVPSAFDIVDIPTIPAALSASSTENLVIKASFSSKPARNLRKRRAILTRLYYCDSITAGVDTDYES